MSKTIISPSILSGDFVNMEKSVKNIEEWGGDMVHCDVMDGIYVKNLTFGMPMIAAIRKITTLPLDVHLMITKPERYIEDFAKSGADIITFHPDASDEPEKTLEMIKNCGKKCGLVFNPDVSIDKYKYMFPLCDMILVMSVYAGLGGQKFIESSIDRVKRVKEILGSIGKDIPIEIDGGINEKNSKAVREAGANILVAGSSIYKSENPKKTIKILRG